MNYRCEIDTVVVAEKQESANFYTVSFVLVSVLKRTVLVSVLMTTSLNFSENFIWPSPSMLSN